MRRYLGERVAMLACEPREPRNFLDARIVAHGRRRPDVLEIVVEPHSRRQTKPPNRSRDFMAGGRGAGP